MTTKDEGGGQAFPRPACVDQDGRTAIQAVNGMSLRDYFAAQALPALIQNYAASALNLNHGSADPVARAAEESYVIADAMLEARKHG